MHKTKNKMNKHHVISIAMDFMPKDPKSIQVLKQRADKLAINKNKKTDNINWIEYIEFGLGKNEHYGIPYTAAKEVMHNIDLTPLPHMPSFVAGVINRRGVLVTVLDLRKLFNINEAQTSQSIYTIIVESKGIIVGLLADNIDGSSAYDPNLIEPPLASEGISNAEYFLGLHESKTAILNIDHIVTKILAELNHSTTT